MAFEIIPDSAKPIKAWTKDVPVEEEAKQQLRNTANMPFIHKHVAVMPDVHYGMGATIGSVVPTIGAVIPAAVGVDIGCGMMAQKTSLTAEDLPDNLHGLRSEIEKYIPVGFSMHLIEKAPIMPIYLENDLKLIAKDIPKIQERMENAMKQLGTLGGGNHFIELCLDENNDVWIMLHSGSRGIGNAIGNHFIQIAKKEMERHFIHLPDSNLSYLVEGSEHFEDYCKAVAWAQDYALHNRCAMMGIIRSIMNTHFDKAVVGHEMAVECHHNYISWERHFGKNCMVTRKGAVNAEEGRMGIIPGSMGAKSFIVKGKGDRESFNSCSHGAGRTMSRTEAKKRYTVEDHVKATEGVECKKDVSVLDETPAAYKSIDDVMKAQEDLVDIVHTLKQVVCIKG